MGMLPVPVRTLSQGWELADDLKNEGDGILLVSQNPVKSAQTLRKRILHPPTFVGSNDARQAIRMRIYSMTVATTMLAVVLMLIWTRWACCGESRC